MVAQFSSCSVIVRGCPVFISGFSRATKSWMLTNVLQRLNIPSRRNYNVSINALPCSKSTEHIARLLMGFFTWTWITKKIWDHFLSLRIHFIFYRVRFQPKLEEPLIQIQFWFQPFHGLKCANSASAVKKGSDSSSPKTGSGGIPSKNAFFFTFFLFSP